MLCVISASGWLRARAGMQKRLASALGPNARQLALLMLVRWHWQQMRSLPCAQTALNALSRKLSAIGLNQGSHTGKQPRVGWGTAAARARSSLPWLCSQLHGVVDGAHAWLGRHPAPSGQGVTAHPPPPLPATHHAHRVRWFAGAFLHSHPHRTAAMGQTALATVGGIAGLALIAWPVAIW